VTAAERLRREEALGDKSPQGVSSKFTAVAR
jgi:hypothetical protein